MNMKMKGGCPTLPIATFTFDPVAPLLASGNAALDHVKHLQGFCEVFRVIAPSHQPYLKSSFP
jgi:hypothetical protein